MTGKPSVETATRTLIANNFFLDGAERKPRCTALLCHRYDFFGNMLRYVIAICEDRLSSTELKVVNGIAEHEGAALVLVDGGGEDVAGSLDWQSFLGKLGGPVDSSTCYEPEFEFRLRKLAFGELPEGCEGMPSDLFEAYVHAGLQFVLGGRVIRYGQERRAKVVPDGAWHMPNQPTLLYDAKAYANGYQLTRETVRQFADYVKSFNSSYSMHIGRVQAFLVVSGKFKGDRQEKSDELYEECQVKMTFLTVEDFAAIIKAFIEQPKLRGIVNWHKVFTRTDVTMKLINSELRRITDDGIVRE